MNISLCRWPALLAAVVMLAGCANLSGLIEAHDQFACPMTSGVHCSSVTQTFERSRPDPQPAAAEAAPATVWLKTGATRRVEPRADFDYGKSAATISARAPERVFMLWVLPWVDDDGDMHDATRLWLRVEDASWRIERVRGRTLGTATPGVEP